MLYLPAEFPLDPEIAYLNHAAVAPWPKRAADAAAKFAFENMTSGASGYLKWIEVQQQLKSHLAELINADTADDIALVKNTSEGLSLVAYGLDWKDGDEIVGIANEFPSNAVVWESLSERGVTFKPVNTNTADNPEKALFEQCNDNTRLMAVSSVHFATGLKLDLQAISDFCREKEILLCVDAIQSLGAWSFDLKKTPVDFITADGHKWMLGPEGLGFFYARPDIRKQMKIHQFGWGMRKNTADYDLPEWEISETANRFEAGSPNMLGIHALCKSLEVILEVGFEEIEKRLFAKTDWLLKQLAALPGCEIVSKQDPSRRSGIVSFRFPDRDNQAIQQTLMQNKVICAFRGGAIRFSPHFYTTEATLELALDRLKAAII